MGSIEGLKYETLLVNENGFLVSYLPHPGVPIRRFIGRHHPFLLQEMVRMGMYRTVRHIECIDVCQAPNRDLAHAFTSEAAVVHNAGSRVSWLLTSLLTLLHTTLSQLQQSNIFEIYKEKAYFTGNDPEDIRTIECCQEYTHYERDYDYDFHCQPRLLVSKCASGCETEYLIEEVAGTNLLKVEHRTPKCHCTEVGEVRMGKGRKRFVHSPCYNDSHSHAFIPSKTCVMTRQNRTMGGKCSGRSSAGRPVMGVMIVMLLMAWR